jgi:AraC family transcriptional regulator, regulatory protein of adaptative response / methylated-DNA-[protein]-cysteine methyltransferase
VIEQRDAYDTVARAIRYLRSHAREQPSLDDVAAHVGLSEFHLQRVFSAWAGISPKRFLQVVTVDRATRSLANSDVLDASLDAGLSGPSRLHDLMVACEALTPGELRSGGAGLAVACGVADTPFGPATIGVTDRGVCHFHFVAQASSPVANLERALHARLPAARIVRDDVEAARVADDIFANADRKRPLHVLLAGTNFQVQVWKTLVRIPPGETISYARVAKSIGKPSSTRAVAGAIAKNDVGVLIPCHRVIREDGALGGYRWGEDRKAALLAYEAA